MPRSLQGRHRREDRKRTSTGHVRFEGATWPRLSWIEFRFGPLTPHFKQGKAKKNAWQKIVDDGITTEQAQERYVALVEKMKASYGYDADKEPEAVGGS
jgi:hypothetical protein